MHYTRDYIITDNLVGDQSQTWEKVVRRQGVGNKQWRYRWVSLVTLSRHFNVPNRRTEYYIKTWKRIWYDVPKNECSIGNYSHRTQNTFWTMIVYFYSTLIVYCKSHDYLKPNKRIRKILIIGKQDHLLLCFKPYLPT